MSRMLGIIVLAMSVAGLAMLAAACSDTQPRASSSVTTEPSWQADAASLDELRLLDLHNLTLDGRHRTHAFLGLDTTQRIAIAILAKHRLKSCRVCQYADAGGGVVDTRYITLTGGPEQYDNRLIRYAFRTPRLEPGYYRIDLDGKGLLVSFSVDGHQ